MSSLYPRALSSNQSYKSKKYYSTSFQPLSYYSSLSSQLNSKNKRIMNNSHKKTKTYQFDLKEENKENTFINNYSIDIFRSRINRTKPSPFYIHEKSQRLQDEIDWINKLIYSKSNLNINKLIRINPSYLNNNIDIILKKEKEEKEKDISENLINGMRIENLNKIIKINNRLKNRKTLLNKRSIDNYNYKNFMYQMNKFKNNGTKKWKNEFNRKFSEY